MLQEDSGVGWQHEKLVCAARDAGFAEYMGLPGRVKTGCTNTPQFGSRYCAVHTPTAFTSVGDNEAKSEAKPGVYQVAFIIDKKTTRQNTFYKVCSLNIHMYTVQILPLLTVDLFICVVMLESLSPSPN